MCAPVSPHSPTQMQQLVNDWYSQQQQIESGGEGMTECVHKASQDRAQARLAQMWCASPNHRDDQKLGWSWPWRFIQQCGIHQNSFSNMLFNVSSEISNNRTFKEEMFNIIYKIHYSMCTYYFLLLSFCIVKCWWDKCYAVFSNVIHSLVSFVALKATDQKFLSKPTENFQF